MSEQYDNEARFALFENDKGDNPKRPDFRGTMQIEGVPYKLSGWMKTSQKGQTFLSGTIEPDTKEQNAPAPSGGGFSALTGGAKPPADRSPTTSNPEDAPVTEDVPF